MTNPFANIAKAFTPFEEPLLWNQRRAPKASYVVNGCVFHERKQIEAYSSTQGVIKRYSDSWTVRVPLSDARVAQFARSDTLTRQNESGEVLTIQSITKEDGDWILSVTGLQEMSA